MIKNSFKDLQLPQNKLSSIYRAVVEDNVDPLKAGRCKVRVFGIHSPNKTQTLTDGIPTSELPWAQPALSLIEGSISKYGLFGVPLQGSHVFVFFESGNIMQPRYFATAPAIPTEAPDSNKGFNDPEGVYPDKIGQPDWDAGHGSGTYPHSVVLAVHGGHHLEFDSTPGNERIKMFHVTGTYYEIDKDGNLFLTVVKNQTDNVTENRTVTIGGDWNVTVTGNVTINVTGTVDITSATDITINSPTNINIGNAGTYEKLLDKRAATLFNSHTHSGSPGPDQQMVEINHMTEILKGN